MLKNKHITVTGGKGFFGSHLLKKLKDDGCRHIKIADRPEYDLTDIADIRRM